MTKLRIRITIMLKVNGIVNFEFRVRVQVRFKVMIGLG